MTVLGSGLVFRAVIPGERGFVAREFQQDNLFIQAGDYRFILTEGVQPKLLTTSRSVPPLAWRS